jgi:hypothetical protein
MADFKTHIFVASPLSGLAATSLLVAGMATPREVVLYFLLGSIGGILPDIDSDTSVPVRLTFNFLAPVIAFLIMFTQGSDYSVAELLLVWLTSFLLIKYGVFSFFTRLTVHRGVIHSIPAGVLFWLLSNILFYRVFHFSNFTAWMAGFFVFFGFIVHLVLDELNSLNLHGKEVKKSFGTALKLVNFNDLKTTTLLYLSVIGLFYLTPDPNPFFAKVLNKNVYLHIRFFPQGEWFQDLFKNARTLLGI